MALCHRKYAQIIRSLVETQFLSFDQQTRLILFHRQQLMKKCYRVYTIVHTPVYKRRRFYVVPLMHYRRRIIKVPINSDNYV